MTEPERIEFLKLQSRILMLQDIVVSLRRFIYFMSPIENMSQAEFEKKTRFPPGFAEEINKFEKIWKEGMGDT